MLFQQVTMNERRLLCPPLYDDPYHQWSTGNRNDSESHRSI